jgi:hypothetical protein
VITIERINQLEHELHIIDQEIDDIIRTYYAVPEGQNLGGNIGQISRTHAELVEALAEAKRKVLKGGK